MQGERKNSREPASFLSFFLLAHESYIDASYDTTYATGMDGYEVVRPNMLSDLMFVDSLRTQAAWS